MWAIKNLSPYKTASTWGRDKGGVHEWIVAVKATFSIHLDGGLSLADEQLEPLIAPEYYGDPGVSSLKYEADLVAEKPTTDILINGSAWAPRGRPTTTFSIAMRVGPVQKQLTVRGNRRWEGGALGLTPSFTEPVTQVPIVYERAYGGYDHVDSNPANQRIDPRNPVGCGVAADSRRRIGRLLPNFEYPDGRVETAGPAGFGAIDGSWSPRRELAGTYDASWQENRLPLVPEDWDPRCLLCAPEDQRPTTHLRGGEIVELFNMTPAGQLTFVLPRIHLGFTTRIGSRVEERRGLLSTVTIEPDVPRLILTWISSVKCRTDVEYLENTIVREKTWR